MKTESGETTKENLHKVKESYLASLDSMYTKIKLLVAQYKEKKEENALLKENVKDLNAKINDLKLQLTKINSLCVLKDKEISDLKNSLLNSSSTNNRASTQDKEALKSRIKELISRIDVHLEQYNADTREYDE